MPTFPEQNIAKNDNASDLLAKSVRVPPAESDLMASAKTDAARPTNQPAEKREPATLAALAAPVPTGRSGTGRHEAAKALMRAGEVFLQIGEADKGREYLCRAHAEFELSLKSYPLDENITQSLAACARALEQVNGTEIKSPAKSTAAPEATANPAPVRAKSLKLADGKNETLELVEEPKRELSRKASVPIWSGNLFLLLGLIGLTFYGIASGTPHELLSGDNFLSQLSRRFVAHSMKGSFLTALSFAVLWVVWERMNRYRLVLSSKADAYAPKGLAVRLVLVIAMLGTAFYLADMVYHFLRGS